MRSGRDFASSAAEEGASVGGSNAKHRTVVASGKALHRCSNSLYLRATSGVCWQERMPMTPSTRRWLWREAKGDCIAATSSGRNLKCMLPVFHGKNLNGLFWDSL